MFHGKSAPSVPSPIDLSHPALTDEGGAVVMAEPGEPTVRAMSCEPLSRVRSHRFFRASDDKHAQHGVIVSLMAGKLVDLGLLLLEAEGSRPVLPRVSQG